MATERELRREQGLVLQDDLAAQVAETARGLDDAAWSAPTNCPPWTVRDILQHLTRSGLTVDPVERERVERELNGMTTAQLIDQFEVNHRGLRDRLASLTGDELEVLCPHSRGLQPAWWMVDQRLSELAFHHWDLQYSLGQEQEIHAGVGQYLLPTLLERNVRTWYRPGPGGAGRWCIKARDLENGAWQIEADADVVTISRGDTAGDLTIEGDATALIRWLYGRADLETLEQQGVASIAGSRSGLIAWKALFPSP
jgi:uncharacterized protein (TIGR03083 family)